MNDHYPYLPMNSAKRLLHLFHQAAGQVTPNLPAYAAWVRAIGLGEEPEGEHEYIASEVVGAARLEIDKLTATLQSKGVPRELFDTTARELKSISAPTSLAAGWDHIRTRITAERTAVLSWAAWVLGKEEAPMSEEDFSELLRQVEDLIHSLENTPFPPLSQLLILKQLKSIREALWLYQVAGLEPVIDAMHESAGAFHRSNESALQPDIAAATPAQRSNFEKVANFLNGLADKIDGLEKWKGRAETVIKLGTPILRLLGVEVPPLLESGTGSESAS
jgi:hypothetical protein